MIRERYFFPPSKILRFIFFYRKCFEKCNYEFSFLYSLYILSILLFKLKAKRRKEENNFAISFERSGVTNYARMYTDPDL